MIADLFYRWRDNLKTRLYMELAYLLLIGATFGAVLVLGIFVAPVIFHSEELLSVALLDNYNEGMLMAEIFRRFTYWIYLTTIAVVLFEIYEYKQARRNKIAMISAFVAVSTMLLFSAVYTPEILALQKEGIEATMSDAFANLHAASELDFKILAVALAALFFQRILLLRTIKK